MIDFMGSKGRFDMIPWMGPTRDCRDMDRINRSISNLANHMVSMIVEREIRISPDFMFLDLCVPGVAKSDVAGVLYNNLTGQGDSR